MSARNDKDAEKIQTLADSAPHYFPEEEEKVVQLSVCGNILLGQSYSPRPLPGLKTRGGMNDTPVDSSGASNESSRMESSRMQSSSNGDSSSISKLQISSILKSSSQSANVSSSE